jgi:hypothetical protein
MLTAEQVWFARFDRAQRNVVPAARWKRIIDRWHLLICICADRGAPYAGGYTPSDAGHKEREIRRVMSELGELHGVGPLPAPARPSRAPAVPPPAGAGRRDRPAQRQVHSVALSVDATAPAGAQMGGQDSRSHAALPQRGLG